MRETICRASRALQPIPDAEFGCFGKIAMDGNDFKNSNS